jgi:hypothetical protein
MHTDTESNHSTKASIRRRRVLTLSAGGAAAAAAGLALVGATTASVSAEDDQALVGSWTVVATPSGAEPGPPRVLVSFAADGVALRTAPFQQAAPAALGSDKMFISTTHGAWTRLDDGTFGLTWVGFAFDETGKFLAQQQVRVAVEVDDTHTGFTGPYRTEFTSGDGLVLAAVAGTVRGTRIQVAPLG